MAACIVKWLDIPDVLPNLFAQHGLVAADGIKAYFPPVGGEQDALFPVVMAVECLVE